MSTLAENPSPRLSSIRITKTCCWSAVLELFGFRISRSAILCVNSSVNRCHWCPIVVNSVYSSLIDIEAHFHFLLLCFHEYEELVWSAIFNPTSFAKCFRIQWNSGSLGRPCRLKVCEMYYFYFNCFHGMFE